MSDFKQSKHAVAKPKDLFSYLGLTGHGKDFVPLSMGAPGTQTLKGCSEVMLKATQLTLVSKLCRHRYVQQV